jgi:nucleoside permease NupC
VISSAEVGLRAMFAGTMANYLAAANASLLLG